MSAYMSVTQARDYCAIRGLPDDDFDEAGFASLLLRASEMIDNVCLFRGRKSVASQPRDWPREGVLDEAGNLLADIPQEVRSVTIELALLLDSDEAEAHRAMGLAMGISQERIGDIQLRYHRDKHQLPPLLRRLWPYLRASQPVEIVRA